MEKQQIEELKEFCKVAARVLIENIKRGEYESDTSLSFHGDANPHTEEEQKICAHQMSQITFHYVSEGLSEEERRNLSDNYQHVCRYITQPDETVLIIGFMGKKTQKIYKKFCKERNIPRIVTCFKCNKFTEKGFKCGNCKLSVYCGKECQVAHWKTHKKVCEKRN